MGEKYIVNREKLEELAKTFKELAENNNYMFEKSVQAPEEGAKDSSLDPETLKKIRETMASLGKRDSESTTPITAESLVGESMDTQESFSEDLESIGRSR